MTNKLDSTDKQLIALLRKNARTPIIKISKMLGIARATVQNRLNKLEQNKVILGYTIKLEPDADTHPIRLFMNISVEAKEEVRIIQKMGHYPEVVSLHHTSGRWDLIAEVKAENLPLLNSLLGEIRLIKGIEKTETNLLLSSIY